MCLLLALAAPLSLHAGTALLPAEVAGGFSVPVTSLKEINARWKFRSTVQQRYDFSCGSAAVATLLTYHYGAPTSEESAIQAMYARGDQTKIRREGFSLLDMKLYLEQHGYRADGFEATLEQVVEFGAPGIVLVEDNGYRHFAVLKGVQDGRVLLGDPAIGARILKREEFERVWLGRIFFVIHSHRQNVAFNVPEHWQRYPRAVLGDAISRESLMGITLLRPDPQRDF
jgi:predicted double-glycine peptidase